MIKCLQNGVRSGTGEGYVQPQPLEAHFKSRERV